MEAAEVAAVVGMVAERLDAEDYDEHGPGITEESVAELMSLFELEIKLAAGANALPLPPMYMTVGERKESCGPSVSRPASTVMASVDRRAGAPPAPAPPLAQPWPWTWPVPKPAAGEEEDVDDEWVSQLLTDGPPFEEQHDGQ